MTPAEAVLARAADWGRAPSAHNTQPWDVRAEGPSALSLGWHADRVLEVGDPTRRDLLLSLGCVTEAIAIVAAELQYAVQPTWAVDRTARVAGRLDLTARDGTSEGGDLTRPDTPGGGDAGVFTVADLHARGTARGSYEGPGVTPDLLAAVAKEAGLKDGAELTVLAPDLVGEQLRVADRWTFDGPATGELRDWLRLDPRDARYRQDGLSDRAMQLAGWEAAGLRVALQPRVLTLLRASRLTALLARSATTRPLGTVVALTAPPALADEALLGLGRQLLRVWLAARHHGLAAHPLSQLLDCPASAQQVARGVGPGAAAYSVFRLGRPQLVATRSHRLTD